LKQAPGAEALQQSLLRLEAWTDGALRPTLGVAEGTMKVAAIGHRPVRHQGGTEPGTVSGEVGSFPMVPRQWQAIGGHTADKTAPLQRAEQRDQLRPAGRTAEAAQAPLQARQRLGAFQPQQQRESFLVQLKQVAAGAVKSHTAPRFTAQADSGSNLEVAGRRSSHRCSRLSTIRRAARDSLVALAVWAGRGGEGDRGAGDREATRALRNWSLVQDFRNVMPRRTHSCCRSALVHSAGGSGREGTAPTSSSASSSSASCSSRAP